MTEQTKTWFWAGLIGFIMFLFGTAIEVGLTVWMFKKYKVCPHMVDKDKK
jgi:type IV secretory pathway TrbF-like protein